MSNTTVSEFPDTKIISHSNFFSDNKNLMQVVKRKTLKSISSVEKSGEQYTLGVVKNFRLNKNLDEFIPESPERISFSWVRLLPGETLDVHAHPTKTFIIVTQGQGYCTGEITCKIQEGDVVTVYPNKLHGFCGAGKEGFWALSIQFEGDGLYENTQTARVNFHPEDTATLDLLMNAQNYFVSEYKNNKLFSILKENNFQSTYKEPLLDAIQHWSHSFQKILADRVLYAETDLEKALSEEHRDEEKNHDTDMANMRGNPDIGEISVITKDVRDWFCAQMQTLSSPEKIILMHFVLEGSADYAHNEIYSYVTGKPVEEHFRVHAEEDENHVQMGVDALRKIKNINYSKLMSTLMTGWVMLNRVCTEMSDVAYKKADSMKSNNDKK